MICGDVVGENISKISGSTVASVRMRMSSSFSPSGGSEKISQRASRFYDSPGEDIDHANRALGGFGLCERCPVTFLY